MAAALRATRRRSEPDPRQLRIPLYSPYEHHELLLSEQQEHVVAWLKGRRARGETEWHVLDKFQAAHQLARWFDQPDVYLTPNEFFGWRRIVLLRGLNALYLDFDAHKQALSAPEIHTWAEGVLRQIQALGWPLPTALIFSGRGFHLYWCHHRADAKVLPRWQSLVRHMRKTLGSDPMSADSCRVLRVLGTRNAKVPDFRVHGERVIDKVYEFEDLYERILKPEKAIVRDIRAERARRGAAPEARDRASDPRSTTSIFTYWHNVHHDLWLIANRASSGPALGVSEGHRVQVLELLTASLCWFTRYEALGDEVLACARMLTPSLSEEEVLASTATLRSRALAAANGDLLEYGGKLVDPRYRYSRERLLEKLGDLVTPDLVPSLRAIVPDDVYAERRKATMAARYVDHNTGRGFREGNAEKRAKARLLASQGYSQHRIAAELQVGQATVHRWLKGE